MNTRLKPIVALYKTYRGGEWFEASLESVYRHCVGAVAVMSSKPWRGLPGTENRLHLDLPENCREPLQRFRCNHPEFPVVVVDLDWQHNSDTQYKIGLEMVRSAFGGINGDACGVLVVDTDEVWMDTDLTLLQEAMTKDKKADWFRVGIHNYLRSPLYRVHPQEKSRAIVGMRNALLPIGNSRFSDVGGLMRDVEGASMHHVGYVRLDPEEIIAKLGNTASQDRVPCNTGWKQEVWDRLPSGENIHPVRSCASNWPGVQEFSFWVLPEAMQRCKEVWAAMAHHPGGMPKELLVEDDASWREKTEGDDNGISTLVPGEFTVPLSAALTPHLSQNECIFLTPRLRMAFKEVMQLAWHVKQVPEGGTVLEIGSGVGGSMAVLGRCSKNVRLIAVDPFVPYVEEGVGNATETDEGGDGRFFHETMGHLCVEGKLFRLSSEDVARTWDEPLDLVLVDGNHSHANALHDVKEWWCHLKPGGTMLVHDLSGRFPGVVRAVREFEAETGLRFNLPLASSLAWLKKPE